MSAQRKEQGEKETLLGNGYVTRNRVEAGSNASTVAHESYEAMKGEPNIWGYSWATLFLGDINAGICSVSNRRQ
jgi:hypothetical protein